MDLSGNRQQSPAFARPSPPRAADQGTLADANFQDTEDYARFKASVLKKTGIDLNLYKQSQMHRRLQNLVERANLRDFMEYYHVIERDPGEFAIFLDRMTINVSELFRNPEKWDEMRQHVLPGLLKRRQPLRVWSAGCSYGAEPYTLAILLDQLTPGVKHVIHATDLDQKILAKAREGRFTQADVKNIEPGMITRYFTRLATSGKMPGLEAEFEVKPEIRARVQFRAHNLLADRFEADYDLICCRNVVIYFTDPAKDKLFARFAQSLAPGGMLFVGGTERIFNYRELELEAPRPFFYQRIGG